MIDRRFDAARRHAYDLKAPSNGWIKTIRNLLGMTTAQLAARLGVTQPRVIALEKAEKSASITLRSLGRTAEALDCVLVYTFIPKTSLDATVRKQAYRKASALVQQVNVHMVLENQALTDDALERQRLLLRDEFATGNMRGLWNDDVIGQASTKNDLEG